MYDEFEPIPVVVHNAADFPVAAPKQKKHKDVTYRTIVLTAANPVRPIFVGDLSRELVIIQAFGNDVVLCESQSKAEDAANSVATLPNPEGYLLSHSNTAPTYLPTTDLTWATAQAFPAQISITLINCAA